MIIFFRSRLKIDKNILKKEEKLELVRIKLENKETENTNLKVEAIQKNTCYLM